MTMRVVLVDDEPLALRRLRTMLAEHPDVEVLAECEDATVAIDAVRTAKPDVVFLDIQMPEVDGFQLLEALTMSTAPVLICSSRSIALAWRERWIGRAPR